MGRLQALTEGTNGRISLLKMDRIAIHRWFAGLDLGQGRRAKEVASPSFARAFRLGAAPSAKRGTLARGSSSRLIGLLLILLNKTVPNIKYCRHYFFNYSSLT